MSQTTISHQLTLVINNKIVFEKCSNLKQFVVELKELSFVNRLLRFATITIGCTKQIINKDRDIDIIVWRDLVLLKK